MVRDSPLHFHACLASMSLSPASSHQWPDVNGGGGEGGSGDLHHVVCLNRAGLGLGVPGPLASMASLPSSIPLAPALWTWLLQTQAPSLPGPAFQSRATPLTSSQLSVVAGGRKEWRAMPCGPLSHSTAQTSWP